MAYTFPQSLCHCNLIWGWGPCHNRRPSHAFRWPKLLLWVDRASKMQKQKQTCRVSCWERLLPNARQANREPCEYISPRAPLGTLAGNGSRRGRTWGEPIKFPFFEYWPACYLRWNPGVRIANLGSFHKMLFNCPELCVEKCWGWQDQMHGFSYQA